MKVLEFVAARDADHAVALLAEHGAGAKILAGGTDLLVDLKHTPKPADVIVDISRAADLKRIEVTDEGLVIGTLATHLLPKLSVASTVHGFVT